MKEKDLATLGRSELLALVLKLDAENTRLSKEHCAMLANLTATQARCTELLNETRSEKARVKKYRAALCVLCGLPTDAA
jgi:hypothetical protein